MFLNALRTLVLGASLAVFTLVAPAAAQAPEEAAAETQSGAPDWIFLTGGVGGPAAGYGYVGALAPFPGSEIGNGWVGQYWVDYVQYNFNFNGQTITGQAPGAEALLGYQQSSDTFSWGLFLGPRYRNTTFNNNFQSNVAGSRIGLKTQAALDAWASDMVRLNGIGSYVTTDQYHWLRGRLLVGGRDGVQVGPEIVFQGNPDFEGRQYGLAIDNIGLTDNTFMGLHGGYETGRGLTGTTTNTTGAYFGVDFVFLIGGE